MDHQIHPHISLTGPFVAQQILLCVAQVFAKSVDEAACRKSKPNTQFFHIDFIVHFFFPRSICFPAAIAYLSNTNKPLDIHLFFSSCFAIGLPLRSCGDVIDSPSLDVVHGYGGFHSPAPFLDRNNLPNETTQFLVGLKVLF